MKHFPHPCAVAVSICTDQVLLCNIKRGVLPTTIPKATTRLCPFVAHLTSAKRARPERSLIVENARGEG